MVIKNDRDANYTVQREGRSIMSAKRSITSAKRSTSKESKRARKSSAKSRGNSISSSPFYTKELNTIMSRKMSGIRMMRDSSTESLRKNKVIIGNKK